MALQRKNFRCPRDGLSVCTSSNGTGGAVVISNAELPPRQRKRLQVGTTNISKHSTSSTSIATGTNVDAASSSPEVDPVSAARRICATNVELMKSTLANTTNGSQHQYLEVLGEDQSLFVRSRMGTTTPSSSESCLHKIRELHRSSGERSSPVIASHIDAGSINQNQHPRPLSEQDGKQEMKTSFAGEKDSKLAAAFLKNRTKLYTAFVEKYGSMRAVFKAFDNDGNGMISFQRFHDMVEASEVGLSPEETRHMYQCVDINGDNTIEFQEFAQMFTATNTDVNVAYDPSTDTSKGSIGPSTSMSLKYRLPLELSPRSRVRMKQLRSQVNEELAKRHGLEVNIHGGKNEHLLMYAFKQFDSDNDGFLSYEQVKKALGKEYLQLQMPAHELEEMVRMIDRNGDKQISMKEFVQYFGVGKREVPTDLLDNGRKKVLAALHTKMSAPLTPRQDIDTEYFEKRASIVVTEVDQEESESSSGCLQENLMHRIAESSFQSPPHSPTALPPHLRASRSVPTLSSAQPNGVTVLSPVVNSLTPVSQDRFQYRRLERTDWTRVGYGGNGVRPDSALFMNDTDRFRTTNTELFSQIRRGVNSGDVFRDQKPIGSVEYEERQRIRVARHDRAEASMQQMEKNREKEARLRDWKIRANVRKIAGDRFVYLDAIQDREQYVTMKDLQMQKKHGGASFHHMWAGSPDSQFNDMNRPYA